MGATKTTVEISNAEKPELKSELELLVDSGATYSIVDGGLLEKLQVRPIEERTFVLANGHKISRRVGGVHLRVGGRRGFSSVIFGKDEDQQVLGVTALEELGLELDPVNHKLRPMELFML